MNTAIYLQLNIFTIIICLLLLWHNSKAKNEVIGKKTFQYLVMEVIVVVILNSISWILEGTGGVKTHNIYFIVLGLEFVFQIIPCFTMLLYTQEHKVTMNKLVKILRILPLGIGIVLMIINIAIPFVFRINEFNRYERMNGFYIVGCIPAVYLLWILINCITSYKRENGKKRILYLQYIVMLTFSVVGMIAQILVYGLETRWMMSTLGFIYIYINVQKNREEQLEQELDETKVSTMLSQIQYHFVFNTLATIQSYCIKRPKYASDMLECFQKYLRYNLEAVNYMEQVHFKEELNHTQNYIKLEKMRFGDHVTVQYQLEEEDFFLPVLTLQPLVEHAIRYGICKCENAGTVVIQTKMEDGAIRLTVKDDGQGDDTDNFIKKDEQKRELAGLFYVKKRIEGTRGGQMTIYSRSSIGTIVTIYLPV